MAFQRPNRRRLLTAVKSRSIVSLKLPVKQITTEISTATADKFRLLVVFKDFLLGGDFSSRALSGCIATSASKQPKSDVKVGGE